jgi:hypothetical protein
MGPGTSAGIGSNAQLLPPFVVDASLGIEQQEPAGLIAPVTEQSSALAHDSCPGLNPAGKTPADHRFPSSVVSASTLAYRLGSGPTLVPTTVHLSALEHAIDGMYKPVLRRRPVKFLPPSLVERNVEVIEVIDPYFPSVLTAATPRQTCIDVHKSAPSVPTPRGRGSIVKVWPPFDVVRNTGWPRYVPPTEQALALAHESELVGAKPLDTGSTDQLRPTSSVT